MYALVYIVDHINLALSTYGLEEIYGLSVSGSSCSTSTSNSSAGGSNSIGTTTTLNKDNVDSNIGKRHQASSLNQSSKLINLGK